MPDVSIYFGYTVTIVRTMGDYVRFQTRAGGTIYDVYWPEGQTDHHDCPVHGEEPTTVPRWPGCNGMLFLRDGKAIPCGMEPEDIVVIPDHEAVFGQQQHRFVNVEVLQGGWNSVMRQLREPVRFSLVWGDPMEHFGGAPWSTVELDSSGYPLTGTCGVAVVAETVALRYGLVAEGGSKWPSSLGLDLALAADSDRTPAVGCHPQVLDLDPAAKKSVGNVDWYRVTLHSGPGGKLQLLHKVKNVTYGAGPMQLSPSTQHEELPNVKVPAVLGGTEFKEPTAQAPVGVAYLRVTYACKTLTRLS